MKTLLTAALTLAVGIAFGTSAVSAQQTAVTGESQQKTVVKKVGFRMSNWRTIHGDGTKATQDTVATLQKIGCEVKQNDHGGHVDIAFRCPAWKTVSVQDDKQSTEWQRWLVNKEFETVVLHPAADSKLPTVKLRLADWKTIHTKSEGQAQSLKETYEMVGCEVVIENHGNHIDAKIRCPDWTTIGFPNSQAAHVWQEWLNKSGFETEHDHSHDDRDAHAGHNHAAAGHEGHDHGHGGHDHKH